MSSGAFHYSEAERLLKDSGAVIRENAGAANSEAMRALAAAGIAAAAVHATLALAAVQALGPISEWVAEVEGDAVEWAKATAPDSAER